MTEIRIHGVSGTPPTELLNRPITRRVAGDASAGFHRPALDDQLHDRPIGGSKDLGPLLEGFSWSGLTSGSATRALWILLLPFGLINVAPFAVPGPPAEAHRRLWRASATTISITCRLLAGTLTAALALGACGIGLLTIGTRCGTTGPIPNCYGIPIWLTDLLGGMGDAWAWACGLVVPLAVVCLLLLISRRSDRSESLQPGGDDARKPDGPVATGQGKAGPTTAPADPENPFELTRRDLWTSGKHTIHQRGVHARIALIVTGFVASWPLTAGSSLRPLLVGVAGVALACDVVLLVWGRRAFGPRIAADEPTHEPTDESPATRRPRRKPTPGMVLHCTGWAMIVGLGLLTAAAVVRGGPLPPDDDLVAWFDGLVIWGFRAQIGLLLILLLAVGIACRVTPRHRRLFVRGWGSAILAASAVLLGAALTSAVMVAVPAWFATPGLVLSPSGLTAAMNTKASWYGNSIGATGLAVAIVTLVLAIVLVGCLVLTAVAVWLPCSAGRTRDRRHVSLSLRAYYLRRGPDVPAGLTADRRRLRGRRATRQDLHTRRRMVEVAKIFWWARRVDYVPSTIAVVSLVCTALLALVMWRHWLEPNSFAWRKGQAGAGAVLGRDVIVSAASWGIWLSAAGLVALFVITLVATRDSSLRRHIAIIWDVASFWPRDTHPLAPPCYSERAIPQLECLINWAVGWDATKQRDVRADPSGKVPAAGPGRVILAGHSQGSVIAAAAIMRLQPEARARVALLTYGSVLGRLYSRFFPRYFGVEELDRLAEKLGRGTIRHVESSDPSGNDRTGAEGTRWGNLYRYSDFIGGSIVLDLRADAAEMRRRRPTEATRPARGTTPAPFDLLPHLRGIDALQPDPAFWAEPGDSILPAADRHSRFDSDVSFQYEISRLVRMFGPTFARFDPGSGSSETGRTPFESDLSPALSANPALAPTKG